MLDHNIYIFDYEFDFDLIEMYWDHYQHDLEVYTDPRTEQSMKEWMIVRLEMFNYAQQICDLFNIKNSKPRFYMLGANASLPMHVDVNTTCSLNIVLSEGGAPVKFEDKSYFYKTAILNTTNRHGVDNGPLDRRLFKISVFDQSFEEVTNNVKSIVKRL